MAKHTEYHEHVGKWSRVYTRSTSFLGKLESDSFETLVLKPSIVSNVLAEITPDGNTKTYDYHHLEEKRPIIINTGEVQAAEPSSQKRVNYLLKDWNKRVEDFLKKSK